MNIDDLIKNIDSYATDDWELANQILYDMCQRYPSNADKRSVLAKTFIIGRTYEFPDAKDKILSFANESADLEYATFYLRCLAALRYLTAQNSDTNISPRHLDNLLLAIANEKLRGGDNLPQTPKNRTFNP